LHHCKRRGTRHPESLFLICAAKCFWQSQVIMRVVLVRKHETGPEKNQWLTLLRNCGKLQLVLCHVPTMDRILTSKFVTSRLEENTIQLSPIMVTSQALPSHCTHYKSPWTVYRNTIPPGFENASANSRKSMQLCDLLTSPCYFRFILYVSMAAWLIELLRSFLALLTEICVRIRKEIICRTL
jgi:hypothetical protein